MSFTCPQTQQYRPQPAKLFHSSGEVRPDASADGCRLDLAAGPLIEWVGVVSRTLARAARARSLSVDPDDLAQETWLRFYSRRGGVPSFVNETAARAYLAQIANNIVASKQRAALAERRTMRVESADEVEVEAAADTERDVLLRERVRVLGRSLSRATAGSVRDRNRTMFHALWLEGLSAVEVASRFGMSKSTVNTIVYRARQVLASAAARHDGRTGSSGRMCR